MRIRISRLSLTCGCFFIFQSSFEDLESYESGGPVHIEIDITELKPHQHDIVSELRIRLLL
jgi:hypothetical protein